MNTDRKQIDIRRCLQQCVLLAWRKGEQVAPIGRDHTLTHTKSGGSIRDEVQLRLCVKVQWAAPAIFPRKFPHVRVRAVPQREEGLVDGTLRPDTQSTCIRSPRTM